MEASAGSEQLLGASGTPPECKNTGADQAGGTETTQDDRVLLKVAAESLRAVTKCPQICDWLCTLAAPQSNALGSNTLGALLRPAPLLIARPRSPSSWCST